MIVKTGCMALNYNIIFIKINNINILLSKVCFIKQSLFFNKFFHLSYN